MPLQVEARNSSTRTFPVGSAIGVLALAAGTAVGCESRRGRHNAEYSPGEEARNVEIEPRRAADQRLAFRELGLAIGLNAGYRMQTSETRNSGLFTEGISRSADLEAVSERTDVRDRSVSFWRDSRHREVETWREHRNINQLMFATTLAPSGCLEPPSLDGRN